MTNCNFYIVDVFSESRYSGNQLAVVTNARNLSTAQMQKIAHEFNFSESTFIMTNKEPFPVRIFTPKNELPFAGHPTLGTAWIIQKYMIKNRVPIVSLKLKVGEIPVTIQYQNNEPKMLWMKQKEPTFGEVFDLKLFSKILGVRSEDIDSRLPTQAVSTGVPFYIVPLKNLKSLRSCKINKDAYFKLVKNHRAKSILAFSPQAYSKDGNLAVRVFTEYYGVPEDPATGSGNGCLAAYLSKYRYFGSREIKVKVQQGYEIGRPSKLFLMIKRENNFAVMVGGKVFEVAKGTITI